MLYKIYMLWFAFKVATCNCSSEIRKSNFKAQKSYYSISKTGRLPKCINENSGLTKAWQEDFYWTHNDGGGKSELYMINQKGRVFDTLKIADSKNIDWEDLAKDDKGNIYVGDFGNNSQNRKDLAIYKVKNEKTEKINFHYADQSHFPSKKKTFDCEAFFWHKGKLYLFSKNWEKDHQVMLYSLSDHTTEKSSHGECLMPQDSIFLKSMVTAADISPNGKEFALLTYGKIFIFGIDGEKINFSKPKACIKIGKNQAEGLVYLNDRDLIFTNEQRKIFLLKKQSL